MTLTCRPINQSAGSPSYSASNERQAMSALVQNTSSRPFGTTSGKHPGTGIVVSRSGTTLSATSGSAIIDPASTSVQGAYLVGYDNTASAFSQTITAADPTNPRIDIVSLQVSDTDIDSSGGRAAAFVYTVGTPAGSPSAPATPARSLRLCTISVPNSGGGGAGSATVTNDATYAVATGGVLPVATYATLPGTAYEGAYGDIAADDKLMRYTGGGWQPVAPAFGWLIQAVSASDINSGSATDVITISPSISVPGWAQDGTHKLWVKAYANPVIVTANSTFMNRLSNGVTLPDEGSTAQYGANGASGTGFDLVIAGTFTIGNGVTTMAPKIQTWRTAGTGAIRYNGGSGTAIRWEWWIV
jgi:hypothetical protein